MQKLIASALLGLTLISLHAQQIVGSWQFNGNFDAQIGAPITGFGFGDFETALINGQQAGVWAFEAGAYLIVPNGACANGGGQLLNQYTLIMDVLFPTIPGFTALLQTNPQNTDDADWFINPQRGMGVAGDYFDPLSRFQNGEWQRVVVVIDTTSPSGDDTTVYRVYINGALHNIVQRPSGWGVDGRFSLQDVILIFADEDFETAPGWINNLQLRNYPVSDAEVADLGGPTAGSLPITLGVTGSWTFDNTYDAQVGIAAQLIGAGSFTTETIGGQSAQVLSFERNAYLRIEHGIAPNGGGSRVNQYTVIMDIKFPSNRTSFNGFTCLFQTNPANTDDGDCFINAANGIGISGDYGDPTNVRFTANEWQRIALVVDTTSPAGNATYKSYVNGVLQNQVQLPSGWGVDGRYALGDTFLVFADNSNEVASGYINSMQLRSYAMSDAELAALGAPSAAGIPIPVEGDVNRDGCVDDADLLAVLFAFGANDPCIALEDLNRDGTVDDADLLLMLFNFGNGC
ncbi:MAG: hypothetical protein WHS44_09605 [Fimbriimonadales bacterium]|nr:MAG: hypothetical protein KatS3mg018_0220 [Fimbriimonadales bacterium]